VNNLDAAPTVEDIFAASRQGAANVAGVRFQLIITAWLLLTPGAVESGVVRVRPEGLEDIDVERADGRGLLLVQAKEREGGRTTWPVGAMASAIGHAADALRADDTSAFAVATNARPGRGLEATGLATSLSDALSTEHATALRASISCVGAEPAFIDRVHLLSQPIIDLVDQTIEALATEYGLHLAVAEIAWAQIVWSLQDMAAAARERDHDTAAWADRTWVDELVTRVVASINPDALDAPLRDGLVSYVDFANPLDIPLDEFLLGVDVRPGHVAAGLDILRPSSMQSVFEALARGSGALIRGPSGAGKSALLWRCAYEIAGRARLVRLHRVMPDHVEALVRWLGLLRPSATRPIVLCADDLGDSSLDGWPELVRRLADVPHVLTLCAAREEDFTPSLLGSRLELVRPHLDEELANQIATQLQARGVPLRRAVEEALNEAQGLLMEFLSLLTTGSRLEQVIGEQVHDRLDPARATERAALTYVAAAHTAGLGIPYETLATLVNDNAGLPGALSRLNAEFLVRQDDQHRWRGLHEVRSLAVHQALYDTPPPTEQDTFEALVNALEPHDVAHLLQRQADRRFDVAKLLPAVTARLQEPAIDAAGVTFILDALYEIDAVVHARACWAYTLAAGGASAASAALMFAYGIRFADVAPPPSTAVRTLAAGLPPQPPSLGRQAADALGGHRLVDLALAASPATAVHLLEACAVDAATLLEIEEATEIVEPATSAPLDLWARWCFAAWSLAGRPDNAQGLLGSVGDRLDRIAELDDLYAFDGRLTTELRQRVGLCAALACPEAKRIRLTVSTPRNNGEALSPDDPITAERRWFRSPGIEQRRYRNFLAALDRIRAADSLTERLELQDVLTEQLAVLCLAAPARLLHSSDNAGRRRQWIVAVDAAAERAGALPTPPLATAGGATNDDDPVGDRINKVVLTLQLIARSLEPHGSPVVPQGLAETLHEVLAPLIVGERALTAQLAARFAADLTGPVTALARTADALAYDRTIRVTGRGSHPSVEAAVGALVSSTLTRQRETERELLEAELNGFDAVLHPCETRLERGFSGLRWLVAVPGEERDEVLWDRLGNRLEDEQITALAFRIFVAPVINGKMLSMLGWQIGRTRPFTATREQIETLAAEAGVAVLQDDALDEDLSLLDELVQASKLAAHAALRTESAFDATDLVSRAQENIVQCREHASRLNRFPGELSLEALFDLVERELAGEDTISLIFGDVLLRRHGDENVASMGTSIVRSLMVGLAAQT
jgi:hypothetical protein